MMPGMDSLAASRIADDVFTSTPELASVPGVAYALVHRGELVHAAGRGDAVPGGGVPDADTVFRIASMTKSFTAAAVLLLRDAGQLRLDDPVASHLPAFGAAGALDGPAVTIRDLLTMGGGLPTDDPWGDRQESLSAGAFDRLLAAGLSFVRPARTRFEYSNTGYAALGRVIEEVSGRSYHEFVLTELCAPLGMVSTVFDGQDVPGERLAIGYRIARGGMRVAEPAVAPGAYSAMGGLHSTLRDLARWVGAYAQSWTGPTSHPVGRWSLREAQELARLVGVDEARGAAAGPCATGYGYGLYVQEDRVLGRVVSHSGGYPGFGSHMRWHPGSGWGVVALGNATYAPMHIAAREALARIVLGSGAAHGSRPPVPVPPWPRTAAAMDLAEELVRGRVEAVDEDLWAPNMDLDVPWDERLAALADVREAIGMPERVVDSVEHATPAQATWTMTGDGGSVRLELLMTPERVPRIQGLVVKLLDGDQDDPAREATDET